MIYLIHPDTHTTRSCECERTALLAEAQGFVRVPHATWRTCRRYNDAQDHARIRAEDATLAPIITAPKRYVADGGLVCVKCGGCGSLFVRGDECQQCHARLV